MLALAPRAVQQQIDTILMLPQCPSSHWQNTDDHIGQVSILLGETYLYSKLFVWHFYLPNLK
jgi:hypothetical protein